MNVPASTVLTAPVLAVDAGTCPLHPHCTRPAGHVPSVQQERFARQHAAAELRRNLGLSKREARDWYDRLVHHDRLRRGRTVVALLIAGGR